MVISMSAWELDSHQMTNWPMCGPHGFGALNDVGKELLSFLSVNDATLCNTWFVKKGIKKCIWQHPKSKEWPCIDYAALRQKDRRMCLDATVMRGAECHTDHQLLQIKLRVHQANVTRKQLQKGRKYNVSQLRERKLRDRTADEVRKKFQQELSHEVEELWLTDGDGTVKETWSAVRDTLKETTESVLGYEGKKQPDWCSESAYIIEPALKQRSECYQRWITTGRVRDHAKFAKARALARRTIREAKMHGLDLKQKKLNMIGSVGRRYGSASKM